MMGGDSSREDLAMKLMSPQLVLEDAKSADREQRRADDHAAEQGESKDDGDHSSIRARVRHTVTVHSWLEVLAAARVRAMSLPLLLTASRIDVA